MKNVYIVCLLAFALSSCNETQPSLSWQYSETIVLDGINPIGLALSEDGLWLSDGDHNRVVAIDDAGNTITTIDSLDRPMHIATAGNEILIPQYGNDEVVRFRESEKNIITTKDSLDAPAGVDLRGAEIAIADFYNNRIHYTQDGIEWIVFGQEGKAPGDFYYPTDVQITENEIWVADAYNNRIQSFTKNGTHIKTVGEDQKMNATTGIYISDDEIFATDFENNRIMVFEKTGRFKQELRAEISKPTDLLIKDGRLIVANYKGSNLTIYTMQETPAVVDHENHDDHNH